MALQIWLPLTGTLENKGLYPAVFGNNNATVDTAGKIGSCYSFSATSGTGINYSPGTAAFTTFMETFIDNHSFSLCGWFNVASSITSSTPLVYITYGIMFNVGATTSFTMYNSSRTATLNANTATNDGKWHHYAATYDYGTNMMYIYVDGVLKNSQIYNNSATYVHSWVNNFYIGRNPNNSTASSSYFYQGKVNDIRFYDHCLSPKEVHEIAQGLIIHYPLRLNSKPNVNLCPSGSQRMTEEGTTSSNEYMSILNPMTVFDTYGLVPYTVSFDIKAAVAHSFSLYGTPGNGYKHNFTSTTINVGTEWKRISYTFTPFLASETGTWDSISVYGTYGSGAIVSVRRVKLELGTVATSFLEDGSTVIYDCSGYGHNGSVNGAILQDASSPRNDASVKYPDSACSIGLGNITTMLPEGVFTFNVWFKKVTGEWSSKAWETIFGGPSGFELQSKISSTNAPYVQLYSWGGGSTQGTYSIPYELDKWNMVTMVRTDSGTKFYLNGEWKVDGSGRGNFPSGNYWLGSWNSATQQNFRGYFSDARIYATALSATDIRELYDTAASIDNLGSMHGYEFIEETVNKEQIHQTGLIKINNFIEADFGESESSKIMVASDGAKFLQILHHNNPASNLFTSANCWCNNSTNLYSNLVLLKNASWLTGLSEWEFIECEKITSDATESQYRWKQTNNPALTSTLSGYEVISGNPPRSMGLINTETYSAMHQGPSTWYVACGCYTAWNGGIPGASSTAITTGYLDLYVRIPDSVLGTLADKVRFYTTSITGKQILEV